ncbi:MAG: enolase C-terminal domain-like protein [Pseudomonadota bacterium]
MMKVECTTVRQVSFPLTTPYKLSTGNKLVFEPYIVEVRAEGRTGWGECMVSPGYTTETREGSWKALVEMARRLQDVQVGDGYGVVAEFAQHYPGVSSAMYGALDMLSGEPLLKTLADTHVPLLAPCQGHGASELRDEIAALLEQGFRTLKVKVGFDWQRDLDRVQMIQAVAAGRASLRLDANRGFSQADGIAFASRLAPASIELFEQPCGSDDWAANAAVAAASTVPVMLDESIYGRPDIDRAARMANVGFVKLKLKKIGRVRQLAEDLQHIRDCGMVPVLGDGVSLEIACWMEACVGAHGIDNAGEMNGFLKARSRMLENPLAFRDGGIHLPAGYWPRVDRDALAHHTIQEAASRRDMVH